MRWLLDQTLGRLLVWGGQAVVARYVAEPRPGDDDEV